MNRNEAHNYLILSNNYYPFGSVAKGRSFSSTAYRYGFNGKENDNEVKGNGNQQDYGMRIYDNRLGRFLSLDPLQQKFASHSPYNFSLNSPLMMNDPDGMKPKVQVISNDDGSTTIKITNYVYAYRKGKENQNRTIDSKIIDNQLKGGTTEVDGKTVHIDISTEIVYVKNKKEAKAKIDANEGFGVIMQLGDKGGDHSSSGKYDYIRIGKNNTDKQTAHEIGHDIGFGDHYIKTGDGTFPETTRADGLMAGNNPLNQLELEIIAKDVMSKNSLGTQQSFNGNKVIRPVIKQDDSFKKGQIINVYTKVQGEKDKSQSINPASLGDIKQVKVQTVNGTPKGELMKK